MAQHEDHTQRYRPDSAAVPPAPNAGGPPPAPPAQPPPMEQSDTMAIRRRLQSQGPPAAAAQPVPSPQANPLAGPASGPITGPMSRPMSAPVSGPGGSIRVSTRSSGARGGMADMPPIEPANPAESLMAEPMVAENKRTCSSCGKPAGRAQAGRPGRTDGYCPHCRTPYWFTPSLGPGDLLAERYEVLGTIAHGGLGWIYLANDTNFQDDLQDRWVVIKGLISTNDEDAIESAINERRFLVGIDHPNVVNIIDFVTAVDERSGEIQSYLVMEYLAGKSLRDIREQTDENGERAPMAVANVLTYTLEILPAFEYLHNNNLLFCDFKPDNVIHVETWLKLIDLGAVRRIDDTESAVYGTPGYSVPNEEILNAGPSITSDLYTIGRSMAVLALDFKGFTKKFRNSFPPVEETELFQQFPSFHRLLERTCHPAPAARFQSGSEMKAQVRGVLGEVLSVTEGRPLYEPSTLFSGEAAVFGVPDIEADAFRVATPQEVLGALPRPLPDPDDPSSVFLSTITASQPALVLAELANAPEQSHEVNLRRIEALIEMGDLATAVQALNHLIQTHGNTWQANWLGGLLQLANSDLQGAYHSFDSVFSHLPGELAPRLAVAACAELAGFTTAAAIHYQRIWSCDRRFISAAFGHARLLAASHYPAEAITVLQQIPSTSSQYETAQLAAIQGALRVPQPPGLNELHYLGNNLVDLQLEPARHQLVAGRLLQYALHYVTNMGDSEGPPVLNTNPNEKELRFALEDSYRKLAHAQSDRAKQVHYVDLANANRPRTLL